MQKARRGLPMFAKTDLYASVFLALISTSGIPFLRTLMRGFALDPLGGGTISNSG